VKKWPFALLGDEHCAYSKWRHGDYIKINEHGGVIIYGRSDAILKPRVMSIGTAEIHRQLEHLHEIEDIYMITDFNGGILIKKCNYSYPIWVYVTAYVRKLITQCWTFQHHFFRNL
jgi:hypothetical protein